MKKYYIYVSFVKSNTRSGKIIRKLTGWNYSHVSLSLNNKLNEYYAFSRFNYKSSFMAGFTKEYKSNYTLLKNKPAEITYYKIPISKIEKYYIDNFIKEISNDSEYIFNYPSMFTTTILHGFELYKSYNCITFVSKILTFCSSVNLSKKYYKYDLNELEKDLKDFYYKKDSFIINRLDYDNKFFEDIPFLKRKQEEFKLVFECFYRLFFKKSSIKYNEKKYEEQIKRKSIRAFNALAKSYDKGYSGYNPRKNYDRIIDLIDFNSNNKILDIGCGTGKLLSKIYDKNNDNILHGIDISPKMIKKAYDNNNSKRINFLVGDAENLPYENETFDIVISSESFHHYPNPNKALSEFKRVLKNKGIIIFCDMYRPIPVRNFMNFMFHFTNTGDVKMYSKKQIEELFEINNLKILYLKYYYSSYIYMLKK